MTSLILPWSQLCVCLLEGVILSLVYLALLWGTVRALPHVHYKALFLLCSTIIRLVLLFTAVLMLSQRNPAKIIWIITSLVITRLITVGLVKTRRKA